MVFGCHDYLQPIIKFTLTDIDPDINLSKASKVIVRCPALTVNHFKMRCVTRADKTLSATPLFNLPGAGVIKLNLNCPHADGTEAMQLNYLVQAIMNPPHALFHF